MKYRKLGDTGLWVSETGFGTIPVLQGSVPVLPDYYNLDESEAIAVMKHAFELGCNLFDTAIVPEYGDAEIKLGKFAAAVGRERIVISDKARFFDGNGMYQAVLESCENMGTRADLYFVHQADAEHEEEIFAKGGAIDALAELKREGMLGFVGVASHYYDILLRAAKDPRVDVLQGSGNLLERGMLERISREPLFWRKGILVNKVYAAGLLPAYFSTRTLIEGVLSYPVSSALIGVGTFKQADAAFGFCGEETDGKIPAFEEALSVLEKEFDPIPCDRCQRCVCPCGTEIHTIFRQYLYFFMGKDHWALRKLEMGIERSAECCEKCTDMPCLDLCPRRIRIPDEIKRVQRLVRDHYSLVDNRKIPIDN